MAPQQLYFDFRSLRLQKTVIHHIRLLHLIDHSYKKSQLEERKGSSEKDNINLPHRLTTAVSKTRNLVHVTFTVD